MIDPSGTAHQYFGCATGKGRQAAKTEMEKLAINKPESTDNISAKDGVKQLAKIIYMLHEEGKDKPFELEMSWLCEETQWEHKGVPRDVIQQAVAWAKDEIAKEEDEEEEEEKGGDAMEV
jgi:20S proteasome subunit alpha 7